MSLPGVQAFPRTSQGIRPALTIEAIQQPVSECQLEADKASVRTVRLGAQADQYVYLRELARPSVA